MPKRDTRIRLTLAPEVLEVLDRAATKAGVSLSKYLTWSGLAAAENPEISRRGQTLADRLRNER